MQPIEEAQKRRLTEPMDIRTAVDILEARGIRREDLIYEMLRVFHVDLDEFNRVVATA